ncbi:MAG: arylesterase [Magnetococcales bacterium]|nr:arylesterase [Magnetococcales bacterium]
MSAPVASVAIVAYCPAIHRFFYALLVLLLMMIQTPLQAQPPAVILCLGDSLTAGYGVEAEAAYPALLQVRLRQEGYPYTVVNAGISGDTTAGGLRRLEGLLHHPPTPRIALLSLGANDGLRGLSLQEMKENLARMIDRLQQAGVRPLLLGMRIPPNYGRAYSERFAAIYTELAQEKSIPLVPFLLEQVATDPTRNQGDGIHPNAAGYRQVLANIWPVLQPLLHE